MASSSAQARSPTSQLGEKSAKPPNFFWIRVLGKEPHGPRRGGEEGSARLRGQLGPSPHTSLPINVSQTQLPGSKAYFLGEKKKKKICGYIPEAYGARVGWETLDPATKSTSSCHNPVFCPAQGLSSWQKDAGQSRDAEQMPPSRSPGCPRPDTSITARSREGDTADTECV